MENKIIKLQQNQDHLRGSYRELIVNENYIMRAVRIYKGGYNSLHSHPVDEIQIVESGEIKYYWYENGELNSKVLKAGDVTFVKKDTPHRIEFVSGTCKENGVSFAQIYELVIGEHEVGNYKITRLDGAKKADELPWEK